MSILSGTFIACVCNVCNSYNMGTSALPDVYARSSRAAGPRAEGIHISQKLNAHVLTNLLC